MMKKVVFDFGLEWGKRVLISTEEKKLMTRRSKQTHRNEKK